ncbi:hypothetical protein D3C87_1589700 [compost metagenome]
MIGDTNLARHLACSHAFHLCDIDPQSLEDFSQRYLVILELGARRHRERAATPGGLATPLTPPTYDVVTVNAPAGGADLLPFPVSSPAVFHK